MTPEDESRFMPICPDFVVEVRSITDSLRILQNKMEEYKNIWRTGRGWDC